MNALRRTFVALLPAVAPLALATCAQNDRPPPRAAAPNIVLISIDTLNPSVLRAYDPDAAAHPLLDGLAARSARFREAISTASWTLPAHASLLTGLYPDRHGATDPRRRIDPGVRTLAEELRAAGYETVAFTDEGYLDRSFGLGAGFTIYDDTSDGASVDLASLPREGAPSRVRGITLFDRAIAYLHARDTHAPLFLFLHSYTVHDYFRCRPWALQQAPWDSASVARNLDVLLGRERAPASTWDHLRSLYAAEIGHLDLGLGRLLQAIVAAGLAENTVVAFVSDHGEGFDPEAGRIHHGGRLLRDVLHVPLLISGPGIIPRDILTPVSLVDVTPTLLDLAGVRPPADLDGRSLGAVLRDPAVELESTPLYAMEHYHRWVDGRRLDARSVQSEPLAMAVVNGPDWFVAEARDEGMVEHRYDVATDPEQRTDLGVDDSLAASLRALIQQRLRPLPEMEAVEPDSALQEQLRSLGYLH